MLQWENYGYFTNMALKQKLDDSYDVGHEAGRVEGIEEGNLSAILRLLSKKVITLAEAAEDLGITEAEVEKMLQ